MISIDDGLIYGGPPTCHLYRACNGYKHLNIVIKCAIIGGLKIVAVVKVNLGYCFKKWLIESGLVFSFAGVSLKDDLISPFPDIMYRRRKRRCRGYLGLLGYVGCH